MNDFLTGPKGPRLAASVALVLLLVLPFLTKPVHVDDANFLRLAEGAARDPWRPHAIEINWLGTTERAFDVLSNPPGIAYWLAPVRNAPIWVLHLAMLPWLLLTLWGIHRLGEPFAVSGEAAILVLGTSPVVVLSAQSLTPDAPLLACAVAGIAGFLTARRHAWAFAMLAGCATLFRYSGLCLVPLLLLLGFERRKLGHAAAVVVPAVLLFLHDLDAYGKIHAFAMVGFQSVGFGPRFAFRKAVAFLAMLGGAAMLPVLPWRLRASPILLVAGAVLGLLASLLSGHTPAQMAPTVLFTAAGAVSFGAFSLREREDRWLALWFFGGVAFLLTLLFAASRYWILFLPALVIANLRASPSRRRLAVAVALSAAVSLGMAVDDDAFARAERAAAERVAKLGPGVFAGHWGWQYYLERAGWRPLEVGADPEGIFAIAWAPWPQFPSPDACLERIEDFDMPDHFWGPRVHTAAGAANYHSNSVAGEKPADTYAPWTLSDEPYDHVTVSRPCAGGR